MPFKNLIDYDPVNGTFTWKAGVTGYLHLAGKPAGYYSSHGFHLLRFRNKDYRLNKLAIYLMTGEWPQRPVYHLDNDPSNFKLENLRVALPKQEMSQEYLHRLTEYDEELQGLQLIAHSEDTLASRTLLGERIGRALSLGYRAVEWGGVRYLEHRLVWLYFNGTLPKLDIDHINRVRTDNRIGNLREVTRSENLRNARMKSNNTSGITGVHLYKGKWAASIYHEKTIHLGYFESKEQAAAARKAAEVKYGYSTRHGKA